MVDFRAVTCFTDRRNLYYGSSFLDHLVSTLDVAFFRFSSLARCDRLDFKLIFLLYISSLFTLSESKDWLYLFSEGEIAV